MKFFGNKKGQLAIFIIVALVIVAGIVLFFVFRGGVGESDYPVELSPVFEYFRSCVESEARNAVRLAGTQGGYIYVPDYIPGSEYAPFSSQLNFLGNPVPYWYYVSGNGLIKEQVPAKSQMQDEIGQFIEEGIAECDFESFEIQGFNIETSDANVVVAVKDTKVLVDVVYDLAVSKGDDSARKTTHSIEFSSKLGTFYREARKIYDKQKAEAVFENYAVDVLRLYAPVDGVEIQCAPKIWLTSEVFGDVKNALVENFQTIKFSGDYYELKDETRKYFVIDENVDEAVNIIYLKDWATKIEVYGEGVDDEIMITEAVGTQEGLGAMGFCYVPYHYVYDLQFPVMVQLFNSDELFQFPVAVVVDKNMPRKANIPETPYFEEEDFDLCEFKTQTVDISLYDINLNSVDGNISYECFNQRCRLGETKNGRFIGSAPACHNGFLQIRADGYTDAKELFSSNSERYGSVIMEREFEMDVNVLVGGKVMGNGTAIVSFSRDDGTSTSAALPEFSEVKLSEGMYEIKVYIYGNSGITIPATTKTQCADVPTGGLLGFFGSTKEKCFNIEVPETKIDYALIGGGISNVYLLESDLRKDKMMLRVPSLPTPRTIEELSGNFERFDTNYAEVEFYD